MNQQHDNNYQQQIRCIVGLFPSVLHVWVQGIDVRLDKVKHHRHKLYRSLSIFSILDYEQFEMTDKGDSFTETTMYACTNTYFDPFTKIPIYILTFNFEHIRLVLPKEA
jgi:hypothetical protein